MKNKSHTLYRFWWNLTADAFGKEIEVPNAGGLICDLASIPTNICFLEKWSLNEFGINLIDLG